MRPDTAGKSSKLVALADLVLDPELQFRVATNVEKVDEYAEAYAEGAVFPDLEAFDVDGRLLVVDGFHRAPAAMKAGKTHHGCVVFKGTLRDAILYATSRNTTHGLPRTQADKRKAVVRLLMDEEWCGQVSRTMATLAGVSHMTVQTLRKHYGVEKGQVLTPEARDRADGVLPPAWRELLARTPGGWPTSQVLEIQRTADVDALARLSVYSSEWTDKALQLRRVELATAEWPWPEDVTLAALDARAAGLDTREDLLAAVAAIDCPGRDVLYGVVRKIEQIETVSAGYLPQLAEQLAGRPRLVAAIERRQADVAAKAAADPMTRVHQIREEKDPGRQAELYAQANERQREHIRAEDLAPEVRDTVYRADLAARKVAGERCADPRCTGWLAPSRYGDAPVCTGCECTAEETRTNLKDDLNGAALLQCPGYGMRFGAVILDADGIDLLASLQAALRAGGASWVGSLPAELQRRVRVWNARTEPAELLLDAEALPERAVDTDADTDADDDDVDALSVDCPKCAGKVGQNCWGKRRNDTDTGMTHGAIDPHPARVALARQASPKTLAEAIASDRGVDEETLRKLERLIDACESFEEVVAAIATEESGPQRGWLLMRLGWRRLDLDPASCGKRWSHTGHRCHLPKGHPRKVEHHNSRDNVRWKHNDCRPDGEVAAAS